MMMKGVIYVSFFVVFLLFACKKDLSPEQEVPDTIPIDGFVITESLFNYWDEEITLVFDLAKGNAELAQATGDLYIHTGLITASSHSAKDWQSVVTTWGENKTVHKLTKRSDGKYSISFSPQPFYQRTNGLDVSHLALVVRNADGSKVARNKDGSDIYIPISSKQKVDVTFVAPVVQPTFLVRSEKSSYALSEKLDIELASSQSASITLSQEGKILAHGEGQKLTINYEFVQAGLHVFEVTVTANGSSATRALHVFVDGGSRIATLPEGVSKNGVTVNEMAKTVTFALTAPGKSSVFILGDFNDFQAKPSYALNKTPNGNTWWITLDDLNFSKKYGYQFLVDGILKVADPYSRVVLDGENDAYLPHQLMLGLPPYPSNLTEGIVSVLDLSADNYSWKISDFNRPNPYDLIIYELHIRDFLVQKNYNVLRDSITYLKKLGVNAIELMPIQEFEGNSSWGYNPSYHFALDKYYGTARDFKAFVDECHTNEIAVILDVVLNHAFGQSPLVQMYMQQSGQVQPGNPWFNTIPTHPYNVGYDFNHESVFTKQFVKDVIRYWMEEYKVDGFRFDLSKGFTQKNSGTSESAVDQWSAYDAERVALWKEYNTFMKQLDPGFYVILEHFGDDKEEQELAQEGMFLWNNLNHVFNEATMGYIGNSDLRRLFPKAHGFSDPQLISYMESHDEERLMFKNVNYGNSSGNYSTKNVKTALERMEQAAVFLLCAPGPKMIWQFGELGYDISIDENDRTGEKPLKWVYRSESERVHLMNVYSRLIRFKRNNEIFRKAEISYSVANAVKYYTLESAGQKVLVIGNFDVTPQNIVVNTDLLGSWKDNFNGSTLSWVSGDVLTLQPGQYYLLSKNLLK